MATYTDQILVYVNGKNLKIQPTDNLVISGDFTAASFSGDGSLLTSLNASNLTSGTVADARLSSNVALYDAAAPNFTNTVTAAGFSGDGSALTNLDADAIASGTVADARLSANVPLLNAAKNTFTGDMSIGGDLTVVGAVYSVSPTSVLVGDNFIDLLAGNTSTVAPQAGGFTVTVQAMGTAFTATAFTAGVIATSNPYLTTSADPTSDFAAGDVINITGSTDGKNDGQYIVLSVTASPNRITVKGIGTNATSAQTPWAHNQFVAQTGQTATVIKARVAAIAVSNGDMKQPGAIAIPAGTACWAYGSDEGAFLSGWTSLAAVVPTLQAAYEGGNVITLNNGVDFTVNPPISGTASFFLRSNGNSEITVDGADLLIDAAHLNVDAPTLFGSTVGIAANISTNEAGDIVYIDGSGVTQLSDNTTNTKVDGVIFDAGIASVFGSRALVKYTGGAPAVGATLWLSATPGKGTATLPTSGDVHELGRVVEAGVAGTCKILWKPQYIATV